MSFEELQNLREEIMVVAQAIGYEPKDKIKEDFLTKALSKISNELWTRFPKETRHCAR